MKSHLAIKVAGKEMALRPDQTIDIELANPLFNDTEMFSLPFNPPFDKNRHLMKNMDDVKSDVSPMTMDGLPAVVYGDGLPLHSGVTVIQENDELDGGMTLNIDASKQSFDDLIGDLECRDVPLKDRIQLGEKIGNIHIEVSYNYEVDIHFQSGKKDQWSNYSYGDDHVEGDFEPQALGFSYPGICMLQLTPSGWGEQYPAQRAPKVYPDGHVVKIPREVNDYANSTFINVTDAYGENSEHWGAGGAKYCNARVAYLHKGLNEDGTSSKDVIKQKDIDFAAEQYESKYPYWVLDADRQQSGVCFYVLYFLDCLFAHLGVSFDKSALLAVEDFKHLCFFTTACCYDSEPMTDGMHTFNNMDDANAWLENRGCGGTFSVDDPKPKQIQEFKYKKVDMLHPEEEEWKTVEVGKDHVTAITVTATLEDVAFTANVCKMWANSDNFPDAPVKTILDSLEASFGIRFNYDYEKNLVTAYLLRDVFRQISPEGDHLPTVKFNGAVTSVHKLTEKITGFRMKYSAEGTAKEQEQYIRRKKTDYDTDYDYREYPEDRTIIDETFLEIAKQISATNMKVYVDLTTGNAYRVKVNSEAETAAELKPSVFEVGQFHGIEVGDCSPAADNKGNVREYVSDFQPMSFNDVNTLAVLGLNKERTATDGEGTEYLIKDIINGQPMLVAIVDEDMEHEFVEHKINNVLSNDLVDLYLSENLKTIESYDPTQTDDGNSPLQHIDWGMSIAMMRGGGTNMTVQNYGHDYDGFGNDKWRTVAGEYALTSDTMDQIGNEFDYNGTASGIGDGERFSLKIAAYKPFRYKYVDDVLKISTDPKEWESDASWLIPCDADIINPSTGKVETKIRSRGLYDAFMAELCRFLMDRKKVRIKALTTVAQLADIPNHWRQMWQIGDMVGFIDKVQYELAVEQALGEVTIDFYII